MIENIKHIFGHIGFIFGWYGTLLMALDALEAEKINKIGKKIKKLAIFF